MKTFLTVVVLLALLVGSVYLAVCVRSAMVLAGHGEMTRGLAMGMILCYPLNLTAWVVGVWLSKETVKE
jgi:hypothetical protein